MRTNTAAAITASFLLTIFAITPNPAHAGERAAAAATPAPAPASATVPAPAPVQLVRPGDGQMSCQALSDEINQLALTEQPAAATQTAAAAPKKKKGLGFLKMLGGAAPMLSMVPGVGAAGMLMSSAAGAATQGSSQAAADDMMADSRAMMQRAMSGPSIASQRKERLTEMFTAKGC
jgi:hypothetical protein